MNKVALGQLLLSAVPFTAVSTIPPTSRLRVLLYHQNGQSVETWEHSGNMGSTA